VIDGGPEYDVPVRYVHERKRGATQHEDDHSRNEWGMRMK